MQSFPVWPRGGPRPNRQSPVGLVFEGCGFWTRICVRCRSLWFLSADCRTPFGIPFWAPFNYPLGSPREGPLETPYFTFPAPGSSKRVPKQSSSRGPAPVPRSVKNCNTHAFGAVRGPWPAPLWGPFRTTLLFTPKRPARKLGSREAPFWGFPLGAI